MAPSRHLRPPHARSNTLQTAGTLDTPCPTCKHFLVFSTPLINQTHYTKTFIHSVRVLQVDTPESTLVQEFAIPNIVELNFSPRSTFLSTWERPGKLLSFTPLCSTFLWLYIISNMRHQRSSKKASNTKTSESFLWRLDPSSRPSPKNLKIPGISNTLPLNPMRYGLSDPRSKSLSRPIGRKGLWTS